MKSMVSLRNSGNWLLSRKASPVMIIVSRIINEKVNDLASSLSIFFLFKLNFLDQVKMMATEYTNMSNHK